MTSSLKLPVVDLSAPDRLSTARSIRQACIEFGFFYLVNHGVEEDLFKRVFDESKKFFALPLDEKMKLARREHRGYSPLYVENLNPALNFKGDAKESFYIGPLEDSKSPIILNQWPSNDMLPSWRPTMEFYYQTVESVAKRLLSLIALSLDLDENLFEKIGALDKPSAVVRLLRYPGDLITSDEESCGASAHSDYGMITLLATDGVPGLQVCRDKTMHMHLWEDVPHVKGAFIVNIGDMLERWTNCLYRSTLHRVMPSGQERYSIPFFFDPDQDCVVECLKSCCSESSPPRFPPIKSGEYLKERFRLTYGTA